MNVSVWRNVERNRLMNSFKDWARGFNSVGTSDETFLRLFGPRIFTSVAKR